AARWWGASSLMSHPLKKLGTPTIRMGTGWLALAARRKPRTATTKKSIGMAEGVWHRLAGRSHSDVRFAAMQRLSGLDASFLFFETPRVHTHVVATVIVDTSTMPGGYSFEAIRALVASRLPRLEPFTRKLAT